MTGISTSAIDAPSFVNIASAASYARITSGWYPSNSAGFGTPIRIPRTPRVSARVKSGVDTSADVSSSGSWPAITFSSAALSATVRVIGPT